MEKVVLGIVAALVLLIAVVMLTDDRAMESGAVNYTGNVTTVGVIMNGPTDDDGWSTAHYRGFESIKDELNLKLVYKENTPFDETALDAIEEVVAGGARIVFATSFGYGDAVLKAAAKHPEVVFFHCTGLNLAENVSTYMGRMYQMRYLSGIAAGMQTDSGEIGYVAAMPIDEVVRGINAFTLGVRSVNPRARVRVAWTGTWIDYDREYAAAGELLSRHPIDVVAYHQDSEGVIKAAEDKGIYAVGYNVDKSVRFPRTALTSPVWNWGVFYRKHILSVIEEEYKSANYWDGVNTGIVDLAPLAAFAKPGAGEAVEREMKRLKAGGWDVFFGPVRDNGGAIRVESGSSMSDRQLLSGFDWFVEGVVEE